MASLKLAVVLIVALAAVLSVATFLEAAKGVEYVQWYVYKSTWFIVLLALLAANVLAATLIRFPWNRHRLGFLVTHAGLLALLAGSIQTFVSGIEGQLAFEEGQTEDKILMTGRSQLTTRWATQQGPPPGAFIFHAGPVDWRSGKTLDLGELNGVELEVLRFYRHARHEVTWVQDESGKGGPAIRIVLAGPGGEPITEQWLGAGTFGAETKVGPTQFALHRIAAPSMLEDFLSPPTEDLGKDGVLSIHYRGQMFRVAVSEKVGQKVPVGESGIQVELAEYLANAVPSGGGKFTAQGDRPRNPMLELKVHLPDKDRPVRQISFAQHPLLNLDGIHGWDCPVDFYYHHPAVPPQPGATFLQTPDGKLYCRVGSGGKYVSKGEVKTGEPVELSAQASVTVVEHLPHARQEAGFHPIELAPGEKGRPEAAALVKVTAGGAVEEVWLGRNQQQFGMQTIRTPQGALMLSFGYEHLSLDFELKLLDFRRGVNPGRMGNASFASSVQLIDRALGIDEPQEISMNQPLVHGKFAFYQSSFQELPGGKEASILSVAYDPGRFLKYVGSLMICVGIFIMFYMRAYSYGVIPPWLLRRRAADAPSGQ